MIRRSYRIRDTKLKKRIRSIQQDVANFTARTKSYMLRSLQKEQEENVKGMGSYYTKL